MLTKFCIHSLYSVPSVLRTLYVTKSSWHKYLTIWQTFHKGRLGIELNPYNFPKVCVASAWEAQACAGYSYPPCKFRSWVTVTLHLLMNFFIKDSMVSTDVFLLQKNGDNWLWPSLAALVAWRCLRENVRAEKGQDDAMLRASGLESWTKTDSPLHLCMVPFSLWSRGVLSLQDSHDPFQLL